MGRPSTAGGNCGSCGSPITFMNVMLCDECLRARLDATSSPTAAPREAPRVESPPFLPFLRTAYS